MSSSNINNQNFEFLGKEEEIDFNSFKSFISRRKKIIGLFVGFGFIYGFIYGLYAPKVWEGRFQIVLENKENQQSPENILKEKNVPKFFNQQLNISSNLKTQVEILSSPSILFDIFNFVKAQKNIFNPDSSVDLKYDEWLENLDIELKMGTSVLNLAYRDIDKDLILPVLKKISSAYQEYAGSKRNKDIEFGLKYLDSEIDIYKKKSFASFIKSSNFAKENKLDLLYVNPYSVENQTGVIPKLNSLNILFSSSI